MIIITIYYYYYYYLLLLYIYIHAHVCVFWFSWWRPGANPRQCLRIWHDLTAFATLTDSPGKGPCRTVPPSKRLSIYYWKAAPPISLSKLYRHYGGTVRRIPQHVPVGPHGLLGTGNGSFTGCRSTPQQLTRWWWAPSKKWSARSIRRSPSKSSRSRQFVKPPTWAASIAFGRPVAPVAPVASPVQMWSHQALRPSPAESWPLRALWDCWGWWLWLGRATGAWRPSPSWKWRSCEILWDPVHRILETSKVDDLKYVYICT